MNVSSAPKRRLAPILALIGVVSVGFAGVALVRGSVPDSIRADASAEASASASTSPRSVYASRPPATGAGAPPVLPTDVAPVLSTVPFRSPIYRYELYPPDGWTTTPATEAWSGRDPWQSAMADIFDSGSSSRRLTIVSTRLGKGRSGQAWIEAHSQGMPAEYEAVGGHHHCVFRNGGGTLTTEGASALVEEATLDGRRAQVRTICGHITASVVVGRRVYQFSLFTARRPTGDRLLFDAIMDTVDLDPPAPPTTFQSTRYIYGLQVPGGWSAVPATSSWTVAGRPATADADTFVGPAAMGGPRLTVAARAKPDETSDDRFVADMAPLPDAVRLDGPTVTCAFGDTVVERGPIPAAWPVDVIGGHRAYVRAMCGTVDAVVFVGNRGYLFTLESGHATTGDLERFREVVASVRFDDGLVRFVSGVYGYSVRFPRGWHATPATKPWDGGIAGEGTDRFASSPDDGVAQFGVAAHVFDADQTEERWIETYVPRIKGLFGTTCRFGSAHVLLPAADPSWQPTTIDGRSARLRAACGTVDAVVFNDRVGYWLYLSTHERRTGGDVSAFNEIAFTIDLDAVPATFLTGVGAVPSGPTKTFTSARFAYTIKIPADWKVARAQRRWTGGGPWVETMADRFAEPLAIPRRFSVTARRLRGRTLDDAWLVAHVPDPVAIHGTVCRSADGTPRGYLRYAKTQGGATWQEAMVAGRPARLRAICGQVQAVIQVGDTAFVLTSYRSDTDTRAFHEIADTFRVRP